MAHLFVCLSIAMLHCDDPPSPRDRTPDQRREVSADRRKLGTLRQAVAAAWECKQCGGHGEIRTSVPVRINGLSGQMDRYDWCSACQGDGIAANDGFFDALSAYYAATDENVIRWGETLEGRPRLANWLLGRAGRAFTLQRLTQARARRFASATPGMAFILRLEITSAVGCDHPPWTILLGHADVSGGLPDVPVVLIAPDSYLGGAIKRVERAPIGGRPWLAVVAHQHRRERLAAKFAEWRAELRTRADAARRRLKDGGWVPDDYPDEKLLSEIVVGEYRLLRQAEEYAEATRGTALMLCIDEFKILTERTATSRPSSAITRRPVRRH